MKRFWEDSRKENKPGGLARGHSISHPLRTKQARGFQLFVGGSPTKTIRCALGSLGSMVFAELDLWPKLQVVPKFGHLRDNPYQSPSIEMVCPWHM